MASVLYVDTGALKSLAVAGLLNTLLSTGRQVIITSSVLNEIFQSNSPSSVAANAWIQDNLALGNIEEVTTPQTGTGDYGDTLPIHRVSILAS